MPLENSSDFSMILKFSLTLQVSTLSETIFQRDWRTTPSIQGKVDIYYTSLKTSLGVNGFYEEANMFTLRKTPSTAKPSE